MLEEASFILSSTPGPHGITSPRKATIEKVNNRPMRLLDLSSGDFPMILHNHTAFDQLKSLLAELCGDESNYVLPPELKIKLQELSEPFVNRAESYRPTTT